MSLAQHTLEKVIRPDAHWLLPAELRDTFLDAQGLQLADWLAAGRAKIVKSGPHRTVYQLQLATGSYYLKHNRFANTRAWVRECLRPSKAKIEFTKAQTLQALGVPTFEPIGLGECRTWPFSPGESYLLTRALDDTVTLTEFLQSVFPTLSPHAQSASRTSLAVALGRFLALVHRAGVLHHDFHPGNILVRFPSNAAPELFLIDLHTLSCQANLAWATRRDNLAILNRWFILRTSRADRLRCWFAYAQAYADSPALSASSLRERACELEAATWASCQQFWQLRDRRCLANNRYYRRARSSGGVGYFLATLPEILRTKLLADPAHCLAMPGVKILKDSKSVTVAEISFAEYGLVEPIICKRFKATAWTAAWKSLARPSPALRSWVFGHGLHERLLPTARPLALIEQQKHGLSGEAFLFLEKIPDSTTLADYLQQLSHRPEKDRQKRLRILVPLVAGLVRDLHRRGLLNRDMKSANILISQVESADSVPKVWWIDLVGLSCARGESYAQRVQNIARLAVSSLFVSSLTHTDRLRFLRTYMQWGVQGKEYWKDLWHDVWAQVEKKLACNRLSGRPLA